MGLPILLTAAFAYLASAGHAEAGPVFFAVLSAGGGFGAAFAATGVGGFLTTTFTGRLLASVAISALQSALAPKPKTPGITTSATSTGGVNPCGFVLGRSATAGDAVCPMMSHGKFGKTPNAYLTYVIALGDVPGQTLDRIAIDGAFVEIDPTAGHEYYGLGIGGKYRGYAWFKYYDGSQTAADPGLLAVYGDYPERPWQADMIGTGVPYVICTFRYSRDLFKSLPEVLFECGGIKVYDPRKDSSAGGAGAHRWGNSATYEPSTNNAVLAYNIQRGIVLPNLGIWGGRAEAEDLPLPNWFAAMNACDVTVGSPAVAQYQAGIEVRVDMEPAAILEELMKACTGQIAEVGGAFKIRIGGPGLPVMFISDDDLIVTKPQDYAPFAQSDQRQNGIDAKYPDPEAVWQTKSAPSLYNAAWEAEDGDRRVASLDLSACPYPLQVQRVMASYIKDGRRLRTHGVTLTPDAAVLEPLDAISWTSARNGYDGKLFELSEVVDDPKTLLQRVSLREVDPTDYDWFEGVAVPTYVPSAVEVVPGPQTLSSWVVTAIALEDASGTQRRPAIRMSWDAADLDAVSGIQFELRLSNGAMVKAGDVVDVASGAIICAEGILADTGYQSRGKPVALGRETAWTDWVEVTSADVRLGAVDLADPVNEKIDSALTLATSAQARITAEAQIAADALLAETNARTAALLAEAEARAADLSAEAAARAAALSAEADARAAALSAEAGAIRAEMLAAAEADFPREVYVDTALEEIGARVTSLLMTLSETQSRISDAGIFLDPATGTIRIEAVSRIDGELGEARIALDALRGDISLLASKTYVDGAVSNAILDPSQIPVLSEFEARLNTAELTLSGAEAAIAAKASSLEVDAQGARLTAAEVDIDGLQGEIALKASTTDLSAAEARITEAEAELSTIDGAAFSIGLRDIRVLGDAQEDQALLTLSDLLRSYDDHETRRTDLAYAQQDMTALVAEDRVALAALKTSLGAAIDDTAARIASETTARASADQAEASARELLAARVGDAETGLAGTSDALTALSARTTATEGAITSQAGQLTSLTSSLDATNAAVGAAQADADAAQALAATKADASALASLTTRTTAAEGAISAQSDQLTSLTSSLAATDAAVGAAQADADAAGALAATKADASALASLTTRTTAAEGAISAQSDQLTSLTSSLATTNAAVGAAQADADAAQALAATKADASALASLTTRTTAAEGAISAQSDQLTSLTSSLDATNAAVGAAQADADAAQALAATKADASALTSLTTRTTAVEGAITSQASQLTSLTSTITTNATDAAAASAAALAAANAANTLAGGKGKVFFQGAAPTGADQVSQNLWIDTTGGANTPKRWNGTAWVAVTDKVATDAVAAAAAAASAAAAAQGKADTVDARLTNDYMTAATTTSAIAAAKTELNSTITTNATTAASASAAALAAANAANTLAGGKGKVFFQGAAPTGADQVSQNLWIDTTGGANTPKRWSGSAWVAVTDKVATDAVAAASAAASAAAAAQGKADTVDARLTNDYMTAATTTSAIAAAKTELNSTITTNATTAASASAAALAAANAANTLAGGKGRVFFQGAAPTVADQVSQNLWIDTTGGANTPKRWSGSAWVAVTDKVATDAVAAAAAAATAAAAAQGKADTVDARLTNDYMTAATTTSAIAAAKTELTSTITTNATDAAAASAAALAAANAANTLAGGKGKVFFQVAAPSVADRLNQNLWIDISDGANTPKRWNGSGWASVTDKVATDAVAAAAAAQASANTVAANLTNNYYTKTSVDTALAAQNTALSASIGTVNATVTQNAAALATLEGFAAASYTLRLGAGGSAAGFEIVSASDPVGGETSLFKLAAKHFEVTAESMRITGGVGAALNLDPNLQDASAWAGAATPNIVTLTDGASGDRAIRSIPGADQTVASLAFAVNPARTLRLRGSYRKSAGGNGQSYFRLKWYDGSKAEISFTGVTVPVATTAFQEVLASGIVPPPTARFARIAVLPGFGATTGYHEWQGLYCEEQIDTTLIVDGAIRARHLATDTLITQSAQIGDGIITNAKIGDAQITAAKIVDLQVTAAKIANAAVTNAKIGDLQVDTLKIAGNAVTVFRGARSTGAASSTVNSWTTIAEIGFTPTDGANSILALVGAGMTLTSGASGGGVTARGNARLLWRGVVVREFIDVMTLVAGGNTILSPLAMTEILTAGSGYGVLTFQISKGATAGTFTADASLIAGEFKR